MDANTVKVEFIKSWCKCAVMDLQLWSIRAPRYIEFCLLLSMVWLALWWWQTSSFNSMKLKNSIHEQIKPINIKKLVQIPLFGKQTKPVVIKKKVIAPAPVVHLNIKLLATIVAKKRSAAVIAINNSIQQVFFLGDAIQPDVILDSVEVASIVVKNHNRYERIYLTKPNIKKLNTHNKKYLSENKHEL